MNKITIEDFESNTKEWFLDKLMEIGHLHIADTIVELYTEVLKNNIIVKKG